MPCGHAFFTNEDISIATSAELTVFSRSNVELCKFSLGVGNGENLICDF